MDRTDPVLPLSPGRVERHGFEYYRHGTLSLYAAFNTKTGQVLGKPAARHTSQEFVAFWEDLVASQPKRREIHIILDHLATHKTQRVARFLEEHPQVTFHFTPTYSSWLNQIELWFSKIERDLIARGVFKSVNESVPKVDAIHPALQPASQAHQMEVQQPRPANCHYEFTCYSPLAHLPKVLDKGKP